MQFQLTWRKWGSKWLAFCHVFPSKVLWIGTRFLKERTLPLPPRLVTRKYYAHFRLPRSANQFTDSNSFLRLKPFVVTIYAYIYSIIFMIHLNTNIIIRSILFIENENLHMRMKWFVLLIFDSRKKSKTEQLEEKL